MCIVNDDCAVVKNGRLKLWKVMCKDNHIGLWRNTGWHDVKDKSKTYQLGINIAESFTTGYELLVNNPGQFHCLFTRKEARRYTKLRYGCCPMFLNKKSKKTKIIRVYADSSDVIKIGRDDNLDICAISVSKMEIISLKHQR